MLETIKSSNDVSILFKEGKRLSTPYLTVLVLKSEIQHGQPGRVVFIAGKKQGNAVWRNRAKRRMRAIYKDLNKDFIDLDIGFVAKKGLESVPYSQIVADVAQILDKANIY